MRGARPTALVAGPVLALALLAGCASEQDRYCEVVAERQDELTEIALAQEQDGLLRALPIFRDLADEAPSDIADDWEVVVSSIGRLQQAFEDAGVDPATYDPEKPPAGLARADRAAIRDAAAQVVDEQTGEALASVEQHSRDVCKTELGGAPLGG